MCVRLNIPEIANVTYGVLWSAVILGKWVIMGARGRASLSYVPICAAGRVSKASTIKYN